MISRGGRGVDEIKKIKFNKKTWERRYKIIIIMNCTHTHTHAQKKRTNYIFICLLPHELFTHVFTINIIHVFLVKKNLPWKVMQTIRRERTMMFENNNNNDKRRKTNDDDDVIIIIIGLKSQKCSFEKRQIIKKRKIINVILESFYYYYYYYVESGDVWLRNSVSHAKSSEIRNYSLVTRTRI